MSPTDVVTSIDANTIGLKKIASGKVREIFEVDEHTLLFVASDRISAYDVILTNGIPNKGALLTQLSAHWFSLINKSYPELPTHLISLSLPPSIMPSSTSNPNLAPATTAAATTAADTAAVTTAAQHLQKRSMQVRRIPVIPLESIVRGYITGSAWSEYQRLGTVHGMPMPRGLRESEKLERPIWTPSTKADQGEHDENISRERAEEIVGVEVARKIEEASLRVYGLARDYAESRGIIIADTKFEFGLDPDTSEIILIDEVLTPDSSRFWPKDEYEVGRAQSSYDKQYLRDWLTKAGLKGKEGVRMPDEVVEETARKYREAFEMITGGEWV